MIPESEIQLDYLDGMEEDGEENEIPSYDFELNTNTNRVNGFVEDLEEIKQAIHLILGTERWEHGIYSEDYGVELQDLIGEDLDYIEAELTIRIPDALLADDRITDVSDFEFDESNKGILIVSFKVTSTKGTVDIEKEVEV